MAEIFQQRITKAQLDNGVMPQNHVLIEMTYKSEGLRSKGNLIVGFDVDAEYDDEKTSHAADLAEIWGIVAKLPEMLYYKKDDSHSMPWDCDMELCVGDQVFFNAIESKNAVEILCEDKNLRIIPYQDLYVAKRKRWLSKFGNRWTEDVIMLNGYVLCSPFYTYNDSPLAIKTEVEDKTRGIVRFVGKPNREYQNPNYADFKELKDGDLVLFNPGSPVFRLERMSTLARFDGDKIYNVVQRRRIALILSKGN